MITTDTSSTGCLAIDWSEAGTPGRGELQLSPPRRAFLALAMDNVVVTAPGGDRFKFSRTSRFDEYFARGQGGSTEDVNFLMSQIDNENDFASLKLSDYTLSIVINKHGMESIRHFLFNGTQIQKNYAALYFGRIGAEQILDEAVACGAIDKAQKRGALTLKRSPPLY